MKKINTNQFKEKEGVNAIASTVNKMGCTWRPTPNDDYGIDGEIEINKEGAPTGKIIKVQSKYGKSYIKNLTSTKFDFYADYDDLNYWLNCNVPVILIVGDFKQKIFHWIDIQEYAKKHQQIHNPPHKISFNIKYNHFSIKSFFNLCKMVLNEKEFVEATKNKIIEEVISNLLPIISLPEKIYGAPTDFSFKEIIERLKSESIPPFNCTENKVWTFSNLFNEENALRKVIDQNKITVIRSQDWLLDDDKRRWYINLINRSIRKYCRKLGLKLDPEKEKVYFPPTQDQKEVTIRFRAFSRFGTRKVAYPYVKEDRNPFWVHHALNFKIENYGGNWFLRIDPGYVFTKDGINFIASNNIGKLTTRRKANEWNRAVLNHLIFWREILADRKPEIIIDVGEQKIIISKNYEAGMANFGIMKDKKKFSDIFTFEEGLDPLQEEEVLEVDDEDER